MTKASSARRADRHKSQGRPPVLRRLLSGALLAAAAATPVLAQDKIELKVAHLFSNELYLWAEGGKKMVDAVEKATDGQVSFTVYPSGQLGKDTLAALQSGLADIAIVIPAYNAQKLPLSSVAELPGLYANSCEASASMSAIAAPDGVLGQAEYDPQGVRLLFANVQPGYNLFMGKTDPQNLEAIKGKKIRAVGNSGVRTISALGAVPVQITVSEVYNSLSRGTIDGALYNYIGLPDYDLPDLLKYSVQGPRFGGTAIIYAMRNETWNKLPPEVQQHFTEAAAKARENLCTWQQENTLSIREDIVAGKGHTVVTLSPEENARWEAPFPGVIDAWLGDMSSAGKDGQAILDAYRGKAAE